MRPDSYHACVLIHPKWKSLYSSTSTTYQNRQLLTPLSYRISSPREAVSPPLLLDVISVKVAVGKSVVMAESGVGLLAVTDLDPGTRVPIGDSAVSSSHVERIAIDLRSVGAAARVFKERE